MRRRKEEEETEQKRRTQGEDEASKGRGGDRERVERPRDGSARVGANKDCPVNFNKKANYSTLYTKRQNDIRPANFDHFCLKKSSSF
jgi:hypothetical protein